MRNIDQLMAEADQIIEKNMEKSASQKTASDDDIFKLAAQVRGQPAQPEGESNVVTLTEKTAEAVAIVNTLLNLEELTKIAQFQKMAQEQGYNSEQISGVLEKRAGKMRNILEEITIFSGQ